MLARSLPDLTPAQVVALKDALLSNADRLLNAAFSVLELGSVALARSLAILGLEESGKAIAIHRRQVLIAYDEEGVEFVDKSLRDLWGSHSKKLRLVHEFLVDEEYWFGTEPSDPEANLSYLGAIQEWADSHNLFKQRGFYVDTDADGNVLSPNEAGKAATLESVISHVHQIGWQIRLGEHIEAKRQAGTERTVPPAPEEVVASMADALGNRTDPKTVEEILGSMREGVEGTKLNNAAFRLHLPARDTDPLANAGKPGYEAESRELAWLAQELDETRRGDDAGF